jgi:glucose-1-phosphate thymidylyltransferase
MKLIIPMAGRGTRLRPHSHTTPKPLLPVAGKMIVERIVETFERTLDRSIDQIVFILGPDFGQNIKDQLAALADRHQAEAAFCEQESAEGTAHAVYSARDYLNGECISVFADTIFDMSGAISLGDADNIAWVRQVEDPSRFGVAVEKDGKITDFIEKPDEPVSNLALIGVYYFKEAALVREKIEYLLDHDIRGKGDEFQLTDALDMMLKDGQLFKRAAVDEWLDCGTIPAWLETTGTIVEKEFVDIDETRFENTTINAPVYIGKDVSLKNCKIGPQVSIEGGCKIEDSSIKNSIIQKNAALKNCDLNASTIGEHAELRDVNQEVHVGDHSKIGIELQS